MVFFFFFGGEFSHLGDQRKKNPIATYMMTFVWRGGKKKTQRGFFIFFEIITFRQEVLTCRQ
jgi:hypothetical protein